MTSAININTSANAKFNSISLSSNTGSSFGFMYISSSSATTISAINTWYLVAGTTTGYGKNTTISTTNRITLNGTKTQYYKIDYNASFTMTTWTTDTIAFSIYIDGTGHSQSTMTTTLNVNETASISGSYSTNLLIGSPYIELWVQNQTATDDITVNNFQITVVPIGFQ